jgi:hypothetical protein
MTDRSARATASASAKANTGVLRSAQNDRLGCLGDGLVFGWMSLKKEIDGLLLAVDFGRCVRFFGVS